MPLNTIEYATQLQKALDNQAILGLTSGWMDANAGQVQYNGGKTVRMPMMEMTGLKDYDRDNGYPSGSVNLHYKNYDMNMDRSTSFILDAMDVNESNFIANATAVSSKFQNEHVLPEVDAYRYSKIGALLSEAERRTIYTVDEATVYDAFLEDIAKVRDEVGEEVPLVVSIRSIVLTKLSNLEKFTKTVSQADFNAGIIKTRIKQVDNNFLKPIPSARMKTSYVFADGVTEGETDGGFSPAEGAANINWIITPQTAPVAVTKQDKMKIIDSDTYQKADAWFIGYRRYHEVWLPESRYSKCWVNQEASA